MLILLSPAKTFNEKDKVPFAFTVREPHFYSESQKMVSKLRDFSVADLEQLLDISDKIAQTNYDRYQNFAKELTTDNSRPAAYAFWGDVNRNFNAYTLKQADLEFADEHLLFLSGLYGLLRPLDYIQTYRLEMGKPFAPNAECKDLYSFWKPKLIEYLNQRIKAENIDFIVNLASKEYFSAVDFKQLNCPTIEIIFKDQKRGVYKVISVIAKRSRGLFARWLIENQVTTLEQVKKFDVDGYYFKPDLSTDKQLVFYRDEK